MLKYLFAAMMAIALPSVSGAAVIGNGPPNDSGATDMNGALPADRFTLSSSSYLTSLTYWSLQGSVADYTGTTTVDIFSNAGTTPGALLFSVMLPFTTVAGGTSANTGLQIFMNTASLSGPLLGAGNYWLGLHNGPVATIDPGTYYWDWSADSGPSRYQDLAAASTTWNQNDSSLAFQLTTSAPSVVPEPAEGVLLGAGLAAAAWARRRKTARSHGTVGA